MVFPRFGANWYCVAFVLFAFSGLFVQPSTVYAHYDPKGLPPVRVDVELVYLKILDDWDDGVDQDAEMGLGVAVSHGENGAHDTKKHDEQWDDWDTDDDSVSNRERRINKVIYSHIQCNPISPVTIAFTVLESDQINTESSWLALGSFLLGLFTTGNPLVGLTSAGIGLAVAKIAEENGDDFVGTGIITIPSSDWKFVDIKNNNGRKTGEVYVHVSRTILNEGHEAYAYCKTTAESDPPKKPSIAPFLEETKKAILNFKGPMGGEPGTEDSKKSERDMRNASFKILLKDLKETYEQTEELIDDNIVVLNNENITNTKIRMVDIAEKFEKNGQLEDSAETYVKILEILNEQISPHDKKPTASTKDKPDSNSKPADPNMIISDIEELTRETSELLDKQMEKREQEKKDKKSKDVSKDDKQVITGLFSAAKWLEYANKMVSDTLKQSKDKSQESKDNLKHTADLAKEIKQLNNDIKKAAKESKVSQADLNKAAKEPIDKLKSKKQTTPNEKIKQAQRAVEESILPLSVSAKSLGDVLDAIRIEEEELEKELKRLPGLADTLTVKNKEGFFDGNVCDGHAIVTAEWELVTPRGAHPQNDVMIEIDIYDDGKKIPAERYILADNTVTKLYDEKGRSKSAPYDKSDNSDFFYTKYQAKFDPKKGKTVEFKLSDTQRLLSEEHALIESQFPITVKIPKCEIDSVIDDIPVRPLTDQDLPIHDKKSDVKLKDESKSDKTKKTPLKKTDKGTKKKETTAKPKTSTAVYDSETLFGLYETVKWLEYSQTLLLDAINQHNKDLKAEIKEDEAEYAATKYKEIMDAVIENKDTFKENEKTAKDLIKIGDQLKKAESEIRKEASKKRILPADLNKAAEEPINKIEIIPPEELDKLKEAEKAEKEVERLKQILFTGTTITGPIPIQVLSVKDLQWSFNGEICDGRVVMMVDWKLVDQDGKYPNEISHMAVRIIEDGKPSDIVYAKKVKDWFELDYKISFDPKKGKTVEFEIYKSFDPYQQIGEIPPAASITAKIPPCQIDSVIDDLTPIVVIDQDGGPRKNSPKLVSDVIKTNDQLKEITKNLKDRILKSSKTHDTSPPKNPQQTQTPHPSTPPTSQAPQTPSPQQPDVKTIKLVDRNRSAVQHSVDPCITTHTIWYQFAFASGGYPVGDKITITESGPRGNLVHQGTLDSQGKYQIIIQNPPTSPGFEFRLTNYKSSANKLESALPDIWQFNVGPCVYPGTPGYPSSQPPTEQQSGGGTGQIYFVQMYAINGKDYPIYQFVSSPPDNCNDYHFHTSGGKAYAIDGTALNDPAPSGCGYGKTNAMGFTSAGVYKNQITAWEYLTGINIPEDD